MRSIFDLYLLKLFYLYDKVMWMKSLRQPWKSRHNMNERANVFDIPTSRVLFEYQSGHVFFLKQLFAKLWPLIWRDIGTIIRVYTLLLNEIELAFWLSGTILMWVYDEYSADSVQLCYCPWQPTGRQISFSPWCFEPLDRMCQLSLQNIMQKNDT